MDAILERVLAMLEKQRDIAQSNYDEADPKDRAYEFGVLTGVQNALSTAQAMADGF